MLMRAEDKAKWVISILMGLLIFQSWMYHNKSPKVVEVEAKICTVEDVVCARSDELAAMTGASGPVYMCVQGP